MNATGIDHGSTNLLDETSTGLAQLRVPLPLHDAFLDPTARAAATDRRTGRINGKRSAS